MLAIARALMSQPTLILMDEPSMGLSPLLVDEVGRIIKDINKQGVSIILIEQNARMALLLANRAYVLEVGEITLQGPASEMLGDERSKRRIWADEESEPEPAFHRKEYSVSDAYLRGEESTELWKSRLSTTTIHHRFTGHRFSWFGLSHGIGKPSFRFHHI